MRMINIFTLVIVSIFAVGCVKKNINKDNSTDNSSEITKTNVDPLTLLKKQTELNNPFVINAKQQLTQIIGNKNFDNYIVEKGILKCQRNDKPSECVLNFYLNEYYSLKTDIQIKKTIADSQVELSKLESTKANLDNYCQFSADFIAALYIKPTNETTEHYKHLFNIDNTSLSILTKKIEQDNYSRFLINENPTVLQEIKTDFLEKCLIDPKANIINYATLFR